MTTTTHLELPELDAGQKAADVTHNEALNLIDNLTQLVVVNLTTTAPPTGVEGARYIPLATATGAWAGWENKIAAYIGGEWTLITPESGWLLWDLDTAKIYSYNGSTWSASASGDVTSADTPADNVISRYDGTSGNSIQSTGIIIDDNDGLYGNKAVILEKTATYPIVDADSGKVISCTSGTFTLTLPTGTTSVGNLYTVINRGTGVITIAAGGSDSLESSGSKVTLIQHGSCTIIKLDNTTTNTWGLYGDLT